MGRVPACTKAAHQLLNHVQYPHMISFTRCLTELLSFLPPKQKHLYRGKRERRPGKEPPPSTISTINSNPPPPPPKPTPPPTFNPYLPLYYDQLEFTNEYLLYLWQLPLHLPFHLPPFPFHLSVFLFHFPLFPFHFSFLPFYFLLF